LTVNIEHEVNISENNNELIIFPTIPEENITQRLVRLLRVARQIK